MGNKFCTECGREIIEDAKFCSFCGANQNFEGSKQDSKDEKVRVEIGKGLEVLYPDPEDESKYDDPDIYLSDNKPFTGHGFENYESGELMWESFIKNGKLHGQRTGYYQNGKIEIIGDFDEGKNISSKQYYENGNIQTVTTSYDNGEIKSMIDYEENGKKISEVIFHPNGKVKESKYY